jgi:DNA polymerase-3 subunit gamma/tau
LPEQALYLKWRPQTFDDVIGQEHITRTLRNSLRSERIRHAYLFSGPRGTGKTTTARLLAKAVNCQFEDSGQRPCNTCDACTSVNEGRYLDLIEIDAATHTGVDDVRDLRDKIAFTPGEGRFKVYIIDEVHRFTGNAFDALLKTLEEPPDHAIFVLATTEIDKVPQTIKSRCLQFEFRRVSLQEVADRLEMIASQEELQIDRPALELIARGGTGSVRDSISLLDQIVSDPAEVITMDVAQRILGTANTAAVHHLVEALVDQNIPHGLHVINEAIDSGSDPQQFGQQVVAHLRAVLLTQTASADLVEASQEDRDRYQIQADQFDRAALLRAIRAFNEAVNNYRGGWQPQLSLELALIESIRGREGQQVVVQQVVKADTSAKPQKADIDEEADEVEPTPPGTPPVIAKELIDARWRDMLRALHQINQSAPAVVEHFIVQRVDGNTVYIATEDEFYYGRLHGQKEKLKVIEMALRKVHNVKLRVQVVMASGAKPNAETVEAADVPDDPLFSTLMELGGVPKKDEQKPADESSG